MTEELSADALQQDQAWCARLGGEPPRLDHRDLGGGWERKEQRWQEAVSVRTCRWLW